MCYMCVICISLSSAKLLQNDFVRDRLRRNGGQVNGLRWGTDGLFSPDLRDFIVVGAEEERDELVEIGVSIPKVQQPIANHQSHSLSNLPKRPTSIKTNISSQQSNSYDLYHFTKSSGG